MTNSIAKFISNHIGPNVPVASRIADHVFRDQRVNGRGFTPTEFRKAQKVSRALRLPDISDNPR